MEEKRTQKYFEKPNLDKDKIVIGARSLWISPAGEIFHLPQHTHGIWARKHHNKTVEQLQSEGWVYGFEGERNAGAKTEIYFLLDVNPRQLNDKIIDSLKDEVENLVIAFSGQNVYLRMRLSLEGKR